VLVALCSRLARRWVGIIASLLRCYFLVLHPRRAVRDGVTRLLRQESRLAAEPNALYKTTCAYCSFVKIGHLVPVSRLSWHSLQCRYEIFCYSGRVCHQAATVEQVPIGGTGSVRVITNGLLVLGVARSVFGTPFQPPAQ